MKLALGTAQFGQNYGVANTKGYIGQKTAVSIVRRSQEMGWNTLDTAIAYGESESILGSIGVEQWKVISKLPTVPELCLDINKWLTKLTLESLKRLKIKKLYGLLLHRSNQLNDSIGSDLYEALLAQKQNGLVEKIGVSIYAPEDLEAFWEKYRFDLVQAPLNILDRRMASSGWAERIKRSGSEFHVRSVFLQGLMLMPACRRPLGFARWANIWDEWDSWLMKTRLTPMEACLSYVNSIAAVDRIVVGVDSVEQLEEISASVDSRLDSLPNFSCLRDERLINPASWNKL
jgi:aryl-alcohol dehydrogenase-like predicted oxidoreductase